VQEEFGTGLTVYEESGSSGRFVVFEAEASAPWMEADQTLISKEWLTKREAEALRDHLTDLLERW
jgi:hypothetical protein